MLRVCQIIKEHEDAERAKGKYSVPTFEFWHDLVKDAERRIERYGNRLHKRARLFADQLFDGQNALFAQYCLELYVGIRKHENQAFTRSEEHTSELQSLMRISYADTCLKNKTSPASMQIN